MWEEMWHTVVLSVILNLKCAGRGESTNLNCIGRYPPKMSPPPCAFENGIALMFVTILVARTMLQYNVLYRWDREHENAIKCHCGILCNNNNCFSCLKQTHFSSL